MNLQHRIAFYCGLFPLFSGVAVFVLWLITGFEWLEFAGLLLLIIGWICFLFGLLFLLFGIKKQKSVNIKTYFVVFVLLANFPVTFSITSYAIKVETINYVTVSNESNNILENVVFIDPLGNNYEVKNINPNTKIQKQFNFQGEGSVKYKLEDNKFRPSSGELIGYISLGLPANNVVFNINREGTISVSEGNK